MKHRGTNEEKRLVAWALDGLVAAAIFLISIGSAAAQTSSPAGGGPSAPATEPAEPAAQTQTQTTVTATPPIDGFVVGGFVFKPGGRVKLDIIRDFDPIGSEDSFDPRTIPVDDSEGGNSNLHAKETRLTLDIRGPVEGRELRMYVETDFYGSSAVLRLRQAYGSWGGLLAGQTWSTFVDENNFPNTIDFESPMAFPSIRQAQLRWTQNVGKSVQWSAAIEDNKSTITPPAGVPGKAEYPYPDFVGRIRYQASRWHFFASAFTGQARFRPTQGDVDNETLWGTLFSSRFKTYGKDYIYGQLTTGAGVGRYRSGITAVPDANNQLHAPEGFALVVGTEHYWVPQLSSHVVFARAAIDEKSFYASDLNKTLDYTAVNLLYWFLPDRAWAGVEYLHGRREVMGGQEGDANRLQFAVRFNLP